MKINQLTNAEIKDYCGISDGDSAVLLDIMQTAAISFVLQQTGLSLAEANEFEDLTIAVLVIIYDMYMTRTYAVDKSAVNPIACNIINQHSRNLI